MESYCKCPNSETSDISDYLGVSMANMKDVAKAAGVGVGTVSRVFSQGPHVSDVARAKVRRAAKQLNYSPNSIARALRSGRSNTVGLLISDLENPFETTLAAQIQMLLEARGYDVLLSATHSSEQDEQRLVRKLLDRNVEGIVMIPCSPLGGATVLSINPELPVVELMEAYHPQSYSQVTCDEASACSEAVKHLLDAGHEHILLVTGAKETRSAALRVAGAHRAMAEHESEHSQLELLYGDFTPTWSYQAVKEAMSRPARPSAIFAAGARVSEGALRALIDLDVSIPEQVAFMAFGNSPWLDLCTPGLSTIQFPLQLMAARAVDILLTQLDGGTTVVEHVVLHGVNEYRGSTQTHRFNSKQTVSGSFSGS